MARIARFLVVCLTVLFALNPAGATIIETHDPMIGEGLVKISVEYSDAEVDLDVDCFHWMDFDADGNIIREEFDPSGGSFDDVDFKSACVKVSYGALDNLNLYCGLGLSEIGGSVEHMEGDITREGFETGNEFSWSIGTEWRVWKWDMVSLNTDAQYTSFSTSDVNHFFVKAGEKRPIPDLMLDEGAATATNDAEVKEKQFRVSVYVVGELERFRPYVGCSYRNTDIGFVSESRSWDAAGNELRHVKDDIDFKLRDELGIFLGTEVTIARNWVGNIQANFVDRMGFAIGIGCKF